MKKLAFVLGALIMGFMIISCGDSIKDSITKDVDAYFTQAEQELAAIDNADDFVAFVYEMNDRSELFDLLKEKYGDQNISDNDWQYIENFIDSRVTTYNEIEAEACAKFLTPAIDRFEAILNEMYSQFQAGVPFDEETIDEFLNAYFGVTDFSECDNIYPELNDRLTPLFEREDEMSETIIARMEELYPDEE